MAFFYWSCQRLIVALGLVSMRVGNTSNALGFGGNGSIHTTHHRICRAPRHCGMVSHCAGCSIARFTRRRCRNISARITIRCIGSISGRPVCVSSKSRKSKRCFMFRCLIPFVERLIGTIRREYLDQTLFWTAADLEAKLRAFQHYFNSQRPEIWGQTLNPNCRIRSLSPDLCFRDSDSGTLGSKNSSFT